MVVLYQNVSLCRETKSDFEWYSTGDCVVALRGN